MNARRFLAVAMVAIAIGAGAPSLGVSEYHPALQGRQCFGVPMAFEPTIGVTPDGALLMSGVFVTNSADLGKDSPVADAPEVGQDAPLGGDVKAYSPRVYRATTCGAWTDVTPTVDTAVRLLSDDAADALESAAPTAASLAVTPDTLDPYVHVDPVTGRVFMVDLQGLACSSLSYSDDRGESWITVPLACGLPPGAH
ncbi:MAG TPA: hypothetical protein VI565_11560, partial [Burkholderiales bacterium]|nr:hypothetical protein [Burkholderiales bacterium]